MTGRDLPEAEAEQGSCGEVGEMDEGMAALHTRLRDLSLTLLLFVQLGVILGLGPLLSFGIQVSPHLFALTLLAIMIWASPLGLEG